MVRRNAPAVLVAAVLLFSTGLSGASRANETAEADALSIGCEMDDAVLDCTRNGRDDAARAEALASTVTFAVLRKQLENPDFRKTAAKREVFRGSLEKNRAAAQRVANRAERAFQRGRINRAAFEASQAQSRAAVRNYRAGILVYDTGIWNDPEGADREGD